MKVSEAIAGYLRRKRANGLSYKTEEFTLTEFRRYVGDILVSEITPKQVIEFLNVRRLANNTWIAKNRYLRMFFEFWTDRGCMSALSTPHSPKRDDGGLPLPFVYKRTEIQSLIQASHGNQDHGLCAVGEETFRTILLTLYGTGAMTSEIFWLKQHDLDLRRGLISLRGNRVVLARKVPLGKDLHQILANYLRSEQRRRVSSSNVFVSREGGTFKADAIVNSFSRLRMRAGVVPPEGGMHLPRMRDFRQTFAVHRIAFWIDHGFDLNRMLPALSAYMGFAGMSSVQGFLRIAPERFKRELDELSPCTTKKRWRDDAGLMKFLAGI
jgi:integrase/recombinase XerD